MNGTSNSSRDSVLCLRSSSSGATSRNCSIRLIPEFVVWDAVGNRCARPPDRFRTALRPFYDPAHRRCNRARPVSRQHHPAAAVGPCCPEHHSERRDRGPDNAHIVTKYSDDHVSPEFNLQTWGIKGDHQISSTHQLSGYYNHSYRSRYNNGAGRFLPLPGPASSSWQQQITPGHLVRLSLTSTITPTIINRVAAGFNRFLNQNGAYPTTLMLTSLRPWAFRTCRGQCFHIFSSTGRDHLCKATPSRAWVSGLPITARMAVGSTRMTSTWLRGSHTFHFGYEYKRTSITRVRCLTPVDLPLAPDRPTCQAN